MFLQGSDFWKLKSFFWFSYILSYLWVGGRNPLSTSRERFLPLAKGVLKSFQCKKKPHTKWKLPNRKKGQQNLAYCLVCVDIWLIVFKNGATMMVVVFSKTVESIPLYTHLSMELGLSLQLMPSVNSASGQSLSCYASGLCVFLLTASSATQTCAEYIVSARNHPTSDYVIHWEIPDLEMRVSWVLFADLTKRLWVSQAPVGPSFIPSKQRSWRR